jgi:hypothetical protein
MFDRKPEGKRPTPWGRAFFFGNPKIHFHVYKNKPLDLNLSHINPFLILIPYFFNVQFNIIPNLSLGLSDG